MTRPPLANAEGALNAQRGTYFSWDEFDRLPRVIRDLMNYSPVNVGTGFVWRQIAQGGDVAAVARAAYLRWRRYAQQHLLHHYGPDHPNLRAQPEAASAA